MTGHGLLEGFTDSKAEKRKNCGSKNEEHY